VRSLLLLIALTGLVGVVGCGGVDDSTPAACLEGASGYLGALAGTPGKVELERDVGIADCLAENQTGGDLANVGAAMLAVATKLNAEARAAPGGDANVQLGYLLGAAQQGADRTEGIHDELVRRLAAAARYSPHDRPLPIAFSRAYRSGYAAGQRNG